MSKINLAVIKTDPSDKPNISLGYWMPNDVMIKTFESFESIIKDYTEHMISFTSVNGNRCLMNVSLKMMKN